MGGSPRHARQVTDAGDDAAAGTSETRRTPAVLLLSLLLTALVAGALAIAWWGERDDDPSAADPASTDIEGDTSSVATSAEGGTTSTDVNPTVEETTDQTREPTSTAVAEPTPTSTPVPFDGFVDPASVGQPYGDVVSGLLTFRGNPTRTFHGTGPVPQDPGIGWSYPPGGGLCGPSTVGGETTQWCGTGWTGQPAIFEREGRTWAVFGAYDHAVHFLDADTGEQLLPAFDTGDIIKGSVTVDPDGFPIVYSGSRDDHFHIIAIDRDEPVELWRLNGDDIPGAEWNNDWDGAALILDDYLFEGGENSVFHVVKLNRGYDDDGLVTVDPELVFTAPGYDDELIATVGDNVSIENSVAISGDTVYFANSGGLVQGWDISGLRQGRDPRRVFRYWVGDDVDASIVIDDEGMLYVGVEYERGFSRSTEVGQVVKLDPTKRRRPLVWSVQDTASLPGGVWATPALHRDLVIVPTDGGRVLGIDRATGDIRWEFRLPGPLWSSPVIVDDVLLQGDCEGTMHAFDVSDTAVEPPLLWSVDLTGCIEATPGVWDGRVIFGTRGGQVHMLTD